MNCDDIRDRLEEYALGQLAPAEREQVERHIAGCPECARELARLEAVVSRLPDAVMLAIGDAQPAPHVKQRLHERIREVEGQPVSDPEAARQRRMRLGLWWTPTRLAAAAVLVMLVISVGWSFRLNQALSEERELREQIDEISGQQEIVLEIVDGQDTVRRVLQPPAGIDSNSYGKVFTRPEFHEVVIMAARLPEASEGEAYHVWLTANGEIQPAGTLNVNDEGFGLLVIEAEDPGPEYESATVTLQPGGATRPDGLTILIWPT
jgi:hypothetical protein